MRELRYAGVYREDRFLVAVSRLEPGAPLMFRVKFVVFGGDDSVDFDELIIKSEELEAPYGPLEREFAESVQVQYFFVDLKCSAWSSKSSCVYSIVPFLRGRPVVALNEKLSLEVLLPLSESDCKSVLWFSNSPKRHKDIETLRFVASQVAAFGDVIPLYLRCNASVITLYKSIELADKAGLSVFLKEGERMLTLSRGLGRSGSSKKDGVILYSSLATALWHGYIFLGENYSRALELIDEMAGFDYSGESKPVFALNVAHAKMVKVLLVWASSCDDKVKRDYLMDFKDLFFQIASRPTSSRGWFSDFGTIHAMILALWKAMDEGADFDQKVRVPFGVLKRSVRVKSDDFIASLERFLGECSRHDF